MIKAPKIILATFLLGLVATPTFALTRETNVCFENQSKVNVAMRVPKVDGYSKANTWGGSPNQAQNFTTIIFPGQTFCKRLELAHVTELEYKTNPNGSREIMNAYFKVSLNNGPLMYLYGMPSDKSIWILDFSRSPGYDGSLIGEFYQDEAPGKNSDGIPCKTGDACSKFVIPPEFNRPYQ